MKTTSRPTSTLNDFLAIVFITFVIVFSTMSCNQPNQSNTKTGEEGMVQLTDIIEPDEFENMDIEEKKRSTIPLFAESSEAKVNAEPLVSQTVKNSDTRQIEPPNSVQKEHGNWQSPELFLIPVEKVTFECGNGLEFESKHHTKISIPANALISQKGTPVVGDVVFSFKEYRDVADMAFCQLPMNYESNDEIFNMSSAGMFELSASQNGQDLSLKAGEQIRIDYNSTGLIDNLNFYMLNEKRSWEELKTNIERAEVAEKESIGWEGYSGWITSGDESIVWEDNGDVIFLKGTQLKHNYIKGGDTIMRMNADGDTLMILEEKVRNFGLEKNWNNLEKIVPNDENTTLLASGIDKGHTYPDMVKGLNVAGFGVYNCDQIYRVPDKIAISAEYFDDLGEPITKANVLSMMDLDYNGAFSFDPKSFQCSASGKNLLLLFTDDAKLYVCDVEAFKATGVTKSGSYKFKMKDITNEVKTTKDLKVYLGKV